MLNLQLIAIDTSIWGKLSSDYYCQNQDKKEKAQSLFTLLLNQRLVPLIRWHHLEEILQHENDKVVQQRLSLIGRFPQVAWVKSAKQDGLVGSIVDIQATEIKNYLHDQTVSTEELISKTKRELIAYSSGTDFINKFEGMLLYLRSKGFFNPEKKRATLFYYDPKFPLSVLYIHFFHYKRLTLTVFLFFAGSASTPALPLPFPGVSGYWPGFSPE